MTRGIPQFLVRTMTIAVLGSAQLYAQDFVAPTQIKGTKDTELWAGGVVAQHDGSTTFNSEYFMAGGRFGRILTVPHGSGWLRGTLQWSFDVLPVFVATNLKSAYGAEIDPIVGRWNFSNSKHVATYFEMAGGVVWTNTKIPPGDTSRVNIVPSFGFGWQFFRHEQRSVDVGVHAWHLSNAWTASRNPSSNGILITIGYHWFAPKLSRSTLRDQGEQASESR
jgi:hypothetical protein